MSQNTPDKEDAITELVNQELIAEGRDALQRLERNSGGGGRAGSTNDLDNTP